MRLLAGLCFLLFALASEAQAPPETANTDSRKAGTVDFIDGDVKVKRGDSPPVQLSAGATIYERDAIATGLNGEVHVKMEDGGMLAIRPKSRILIAQYKADGDEGDKSIIRLIDGGMRSISGWIAKFNPRGYEIRTSTGTVGIRGTDHDTQLRLRDDAEGEAGLYDRVYAGSTVIRTKQGQVEVTPNRAGFSSSKPGQRPKLLDKVPGFFRPTKNEGRLTGLHDKIQKNLEKQRTERQKHVKEQKGKKETKEAKEKKEKKEAPAKKAHEPKEKARHKERE